MFLVFSFRDLSNAILSITRISILFLIFIVLPIRFFGTLLYVATSDRWYLVLVLAVLVAAFVLTTLRKLALLSTVLGIASLVMAVYVMVTGIQMRLNAIEFGAPRNALWAQSLQAMNPYPVCRGQCSDFRPILPQSVRAVIDDATLDRRDSYNFGPEARRTPDSIEILDLRIRPSDLFDQYAEVAQSDGDWLAFHATCVLDQECRYTDSLDEAFHYVGQHYGMNLPTRLVEHLGLENIEPEEFRDSAEFAAACYADAPCRTVMSGLNYPVIIGAASGEPVVSKIERYQLRNR